MVVTYVVKSCWVSSGGILKKVTSDGRVFKVILPLGYPSRFTH